MNAFIASKSHKLETPEITMHATARNYALKHLAPLGRYGKGCGESTGHYFLRGQDMKISHLSILPTAKSAICMMKRAGFK